MIQALNSAMDVMMARDPSVVVMGEDVGYFGGVFRVTDGLQRKYGEHRVLDSPISEGGIVATAIGMAVNGLKPVAEIQFADYIYPAVDQIASELARIRYRSAGDFSSPVVIRAPCGGGIRGGQTHSQSPEAIFTHICGVKVVMPSNPYDAKGLLKTALNCDDPVLFLEHRELLSVKGPVPSEEYFVAFGEASVVREGTHVTVVALALMVRKTLKACEVLATEGISVELIDPRTVAPLDTVTILKSVAKTGRLLIADESFGPCGIGAEIAAQIAERGLDELDAPIRRLNGVHTPTPYSPSLESAVVPDVDDIAEAIRDLVNE